MRARPRTTTRPTRTTLLGAVALTAVLAAGCGQQGGADDGSDGAAADPSASASPGGFKPTDEELCPAALPEPSSSTEPAGSAPALPAADEVTQAWACGYRLGTGREGGWRLDSEVTELDPDVVADLAATLGEIAPAPAEQACTEELGPRYLLTVSDGAALTGVLVDDFGCREVRVTDDPAAPVGGVLAGPEELVTGLRAAVPGSR